MQEDRPAARKSKKENVPDLLGATPADHFEVAEEPKAEAPKEAPPAPNPEPTLEQQAEAEQENAYRREIVAVLQLIEQVLPAHREIAMSMGHRSAAISLGAIVAAARQAQKNIGSTAYWIRKVVR